MTTFNPSIRQTHLPLNYVAGVFGIENSTTKKALTLTGTIGASYLSFQYLPPKVNQLVGSVVLVIGLSLVFFGGLYKVFEFIGRFFGHTPLPRRSPPPYTLPRSEEWRRSGGTYGSHHPRQPSWRVPGGGILHTGGARNPGPRARQKDPSPSSSSSSSSSAGGYPPIRGSQLPHIPRAGGTDVRMPDGSRGTIHHGSRAQGPRAEQKGSSSSSARSRFSHSSASVSSSYPVPRGSSTPTYVRTDDGSTAGLHVGSRATGARASQK